MRWNPILFLWNLLGLGRLFSYILKLDIPVIGPILLLIASTVWFLVTFLQIPIPAKLTLYIGNPVQYDMSKDSIDDVSFVFSFKLKLIFIFCGYSKVVERSRNDLQALITRHQPYGKSYSNAVKQRVQCLDKYWKGKMLKANSHS